MEKQNLQLIFENADWWRKGCFPCGRVLAELSEITMMMMVEEI